MALSRTLLRRRIEILLTVVLLVLALSLILLALGPLRSRTVVILGEKLAFAIVVALAVRWLTVLFSDAEESTSSDARDYHEAIRAATDRIWICQTWLPGIDGDATEILNGKASNVRILLASFKEQSPIYARIAGRQIKVSTAKSNVASSVRPFVLNQRTECIRFNFGHFPGWIAVVDGYVFWGPTPVHVDNHAIDFLFHKHSAKSAEGVFWATQFRLLWDTHSHELTEEQNYNEELEAPPAGLGA